MRFSGSVASGCFSPVTPEAVVRPLSSVIKGDMNLIRMLKGELLGKDSNEFAKKFKKAKNVNEYRDLVLYLLTRDKRSISNRGGRESHNDCIHKENDALDGHLLRNSDINYDLELASSEDEQQEARNFMTSQSASLKIRSGTLRSKDKLYERVISNKRKREKYDISVHDDYGDIEENDAQYELFLCNLEAHETSYVFKGEKNGSVFIKYETGDSDSDDSNSDDIFPTQIVKVNPGMQSRFRKKLMHVLRKPYDREEFDKLRQAIKVRKPVDCHLELRYGRERAYPKNEVGKSYLDRYPDLKEALLRCQSDKPRFLNLLRGFFFWLQHLTREGAFQPWKDPQCLAMEQICRSPPPQGKN
ncbi:unnamed protein product [Fraxinus pennsylvanica]|uniref:Uncharacterized protein n=1 Tax=Fraxinus pennsylvanica TaxID=56036 RepID=A0AAD2DHV6_9LAMI|nr:unnamed protein product [Fraxinus pennsylvanica]